MTHPASISGRGLVFLGAWLLWFGGGLAYVLTQGQTRAFIDGLSGLAQGALAAWLLVSMALLYFAMVFILRDLAARKSGPGA